jgi:hypothetical protein
MRLLGLPLLLLLSGCGPMPVMAMVKLARVDFATTDPAQLRAAVTLPPTVTPRPRGVRLRIAVGIGDGPEQAEDFLLREISEPLDPGHDAAAAIPPC